MSSDKHKIRSTVMAFDHAKASLGPNETNLQLRRNYGAEQEIITKLSDMGQNRLVNLTHCFNDARISFAFYAGNGIVAKVIPSSYDDRTDYIHHLPHITEDRVKGQLDDFTIKTYPWVPGCYTTKEDVEELRSILSTVGMNYSLGDDTMRNVHKLPDKNQTLIGIDSSMYTSAYNGETVPDGLQAKWQEYLETVFPIYKERVIPAQTQDTNFNFISLHDREASLVGFDAIRFVERGEDPILTQAPPEPVAEKKSFFDSLFSGWSRNAPEMG